MLVYQIHVIMVVHAIDMVIVLYVFAHPNTQVKYVIWLKLQQHHQLLHQAVRSFLF